MNPAGFLGLGVLRKCKLHSQEQVEWVPALCLHQYMNLNHLAKIVSKKISFIRAHTRTHTHGLSQVNLNVAGFKISMLRKFHEIISYITNKHNFFLNYQHVCNLSMT